LTDVLVGWTLGLAWVAVVITCHRLYLTVQRTRFTEAESVQHNSGEGGAVSDGRNQ
jgi:undecaprenyl-diphosphatase